MGALAPVTPWIPEDDLLLKNAVEAGASLESLAKGAVQFSRRFTVGELQDRWHSLLYDPVVSAEASFHMSEVERSNPNFPTKFGRAGNSKENKSSFGKRNTDSVRNCYYSLQKKMRNESFNSMDLNFLVPPNDGRYCGNENEAHLRFEDSHLDIIHNAFPEILGDGGCVTEFHNPIEGSHPAQRDKVQNEVPHIVGDSDLIYNKDAGASGCNTFDVDSKLKDQLVTHETKSTTPSTDCYLAELSNSLFDDVDPFMDVDGKDMIDKSYYDGLSSLLSNSANNASQDRIPNSTEPEPPSAPNPLTDVPMDGNDISELDGTNAMSSSEAKTFSDAPALDPHPEIVNGVICCVLNTEDPEIPYNEGIFTSNQCHPKSVSALAKRNFKDSGNTTSTSAREISAKMQKSEGYPIHMQRKNPAQSLAYSPKKPETGQIHRVGECGAKFEFPSTDSAVIASGASAQLNSVRACTNIHQPTLLKDDNKEITAVRHMSEKSCIGSNACKSNPSKDVGGSMLEQDLLSSVLNPHASNAEDGPLNIVGSEIEINPTLSDEQHIDSDEDLPNYSDVEAMILDMDLDPDDQDIFELEVSKYQNEDTKRAIVRLEQAACSFMQRAIASHGAFAVLYGRHSKHYIKKPEVLLGRSTEDFAVDIDLGREKRGNKVSRRQAIIRLDKDWSFCMKNIGKYPISVNDKELDPGQSSILNSNSLIEVRGMPFLFETNQNRIKQYMDDTGKVNKVVDKRAGI